jgi:predicted Zn finger-like uncharacterized protein
MKITCERCSAQYDLDDKRIPPSGMSMKCPACLHTFAVRRAGQPPASPPPVPSAPPKKPREIPLSTFAADEGPTLLPPPTPGMVAPDAADEIDLPAPKNYFANDVPAPKSARTPPPPPRPEALAAPAPARSESALSLRRAEGPALDEIDLPAPVDPSRRELLDLPAPRSGTPAPPRSIALADAGIDLAELPTPKERRQKVGISLDAPDPDDLLEVGGLDGPPALELDSIDVVAPKSGATDLLAPKLGSMEVAPKEPDLLAPRGEPTVQSAKAAQRPALAPASAAAATPAVAATATAAEAAPQRRWVVAVALAGGIALLGAVGVALGLFTGLGQRLLRGGGAAFEPQLMSARKQMTDDTLGAYRSAALSLQPLVDGNAHASDVAALAAQARLSAARLGVSSELRYADALLAKISDERAVQLPDVHKARGLRALVAGNYADARAKLSAVLQKAPADASALVYLGWTELGAGDAAAAERAFAKALAAEATRAQALYGDGVAKERLGDATAARELYQRTLARSPAHFGAAVGLLRTGKPPAEAQAEVAALLQQRSSVVAPKELADAWATVGVLAAREGRRDEAEDRLKRALALDGELATARVALARVRCELGRAAEAIAPLQGLLAAQPQHLEARLLLARAQLETGAISDAATSLGAAATQSPKSPDVRYWQARLLLAQAKPDREGALGKLKEAIGADPKLIPAYIAESTTLAALGRDDEALAALQAAEKQASDTSERMTELAQAYLTLGKPNEAEARFRSALEKTDAPATRMALGGALEAEGKLDEARAQYEGVRAKDAKYPGVTERLARLAVKEGRKSDAAQLFDVALKEGVPPEALRLAAAALFLDPAIDRRDDARKLAESVVSEDERSAAGHLLIARVQLAGGHAEEALPEARRAAMLADLPEAHLILGHALERLNKLDQAITEYGLARRPPVEGEASLGRARILVRMGATKDALAELAALAKDPGLRAPALLLIGDCYSDLQQADRARHAYQDAARAAPDSGDAAFKLGRALHDAGRRHDAIAQLERAFKLASDGATWAADAQLLLGDAHREGHENEAAVKAYKRYLELAPPSAPERAEVQKHIAILGGG